MFSSPPICSASSWLCGCWEWNPAIIPPQLRDASGSGVAHQTSPPWPGSLLALSAMPVPYPAPACSCAASSAPFATSEGRERREGREITPCILCLLIRLAVIKQLLRSTRCQVCWHGAFQPCPLLPEEKQVASLWDLMWSPEVMEQPSLIQKYLEEEGEIQIPSPPLLMVSSP